MKIYPEMSEILAESIRVVGALLRLAGNSEQLFPGISQASTCPADLHDFPKLGQLEIIESFGIIAFITTKKSMSLYGMPSDVAPPSPRP